MKTRNVKRNVVKEKVYGVEIKSIILLYLEFLWLSQVFIGMTTKSQLYCKALEFYFHYGLLILQIVSHQNHF